MAKTKAAKAPPRARRRSEEHKVRVVFATLKGDGPISFSRRIDYLKRHGQSDAEFEEESWVEKAHFDRDGNAYVQSSAIHKALYTTAQYLQLKVSKAGLMKHIQAGVQVRYDMALTIPNGKGRRPATRDDFTSWGGYQDPRGNPGGSAGVWKNFPELDNWEGKIEVWISDELITAQDMEHVLKKSGLHNGLGRWSPRKGGQKGRYLVSGIRWEETIL